MKLWQKEGASVNETIERFTVGRDKEFDVLLAKYDVLGSIAHVTMLGEVGLMTQAESEQAVVGLKKILHEIEAGNFAIDDHVEDVHSQVEMQLTQNIGEVGKMIHSGRSRNDQVAVDIKLYLRAEILSLKDQVKKLFDLLIEKSEEYKSYGLPGYTHLQLAMPSSFGQWFGAYAESLIDDTEMLLAAYKVVNKNPLGSGAGYGSTFPLNRKRTTELLEFDQLNWNAVYAQMTRGKAEKTVATSLSYLAATLAKLSLDCCLYMNQNFGFITFPDHLTTGSSIMPHKKNPDVFELVRGKCNRIQALPNEMTMMMTNLPSGYHREMQLTKEMLFPAIEEMKACIEMVILMLSNIKITTGILDNDQYKLLFTVESVNELVMKGIPFRDAYKQVGNDVNNGNYTKPNLAIDEDKAHEGSIYNLCNDEISKMMEDVMSGFYKKR
ncbi:MAG TPA: argininosuccinate lyase [Saprospiraceae bacterium]|nr:argininosuccinate lyase [Saprospiraceae bacterium]HPN70370.1 argininosuccinate lyase [Saprospiraceae bacterium]